MPTAKKHPGQLALRDSARGRKGSPTALSPRVLRGTDPERIALSILQWVRKSRHRPRDPYLSALTMIGYYVDRGRKTLSVRRQAILREAQLELERLRLSSNE